ncbi:MAG: hypothetical protein M1482_07470 [Chloroflexi bacterium]|nr:hypothetical protein [Chloroflexota bacterium]
MSTSFITLCDELKNRLNDTGVTPIWTTDRRKAFVNAAVSHYNDTGGYVESIDESLVVVDGQATYTLPAAIIEPRQVVAIAVQGAAPGDPYTEYVRWSVAASAGAAGECRLLLAEPFFESAGKKIRVLFKAPHAPLAADGDTTTVPAEYVYAYAKFLAHDEAAGQASQANRQFHLDEAKRAFDLSNAMLPFVLPKPPAVRARPAEA